MQSRNTAPEMGAAHPTSHDDLNLQVVFEKKGDVTKNTGNKNTISTVEMYIWGRGHKMRKLQGNLPRIWCNLREFVWVMCLN